MICPKCVKDREFELTLEYRDNGKYVSVKLVCCRDHIKSNSKFLKQTFKGGKVTVKPLVVHAASLD